MIWGVRSSTFWVFSSCSLLHHQHTYEVHIQQHSAMNSMMAAVAAPLIALVVLQLQLSSVDAFVPGYGTYGSPMSSNNRIAFSERYSSASSSIPFFAKEATASVSNSNSNTKDKAVVIAGGTGYIGKAVVAESVKRGYHTVVLVRNITKLNTPEGLYAYGDCFTGATLVQCDVEDPDNLKTVFQSIDMPIDAVVSCLASPSGTKQSAFAIDYQASLNCLEAGQASDARHFILLSAFCCRNPLLQLQQAKLKFEAALAAQDQMTWSVIRPTAFFKSISGQLEAIKTGAPYVLFDDGAVTECNPIAEPELAEFMLDSLVNEEKVNKIMNIGGPDGPLTNKMLGEVSFFENSIIYIDVLCTRLSLTSYRRTHIFNTDDVQGRREGTQICVRSDMDF